MKQNRLEVDVPWMYGVNGAMFVLGSVSTIILSMQFGFTFTFVIGLFFYGIVFLSTVVTPSQEN